MAQAQAGLGGDVLRFVPSDIADVQVNHGLPRPSVRVSLTEAAAGRLFEFTSEHLDRDVEIRVGEQIVSPSVRILMPLAGGRLNLAPAAAGASSDLNAIAAKIRAGTAVEFRLLKP
ncbi:hypothetical protein KXS07_23190 [Inquilinus limosus]|uniref:hypothetical protein n=1 Tax=Inquilinus limosus TaxID=171674 RepID=UPI00047A10B4|nr:hypothetical protein [Inquilinus limosus]